MLVSLWLAQSNTLMNMAETEVCLCARENLVMKQRLAVSKVREFNGVRRPLKWHLFIQCLREGKREGERESTHFNWGKQGYIF